MSDVAIHVEGLGKKYSIGRRKAGDFRNAFGDLFRRINPFAQNHADNSSITSAPHPHITTSPNHHINDFWALKDINFEVKKGEAIGIIGRNGAGKSTLLKILSRITEPTTGYFTINGRVSSLLEVGTGFHMELTGRENIYLNGTILGMKRREIKQKFDEIVAFSGVEQFIDTPVKHYSSGMKVRLAFSVAAHLEPEILVIDEVLAVGDAEFQKKCLGKMEDVTGEGRTVLFVSHNLAAVNQLCQRGILLYEGKIIREGEVSEVIHSYVTLNRLNNDQSDLINLDQRKGNGKFRVKTIRMLDGKFKVVKIAKTGSELVFEVKFDSNISLSDGIFRIDFAIDTEQNMRVGWFSSDAVKNKFTDDFEILHLKIPKLILGGGTYYLTFYVTMNGNVVDYIHQGYQFEIEDGDFFGTGRTIPKTQTFIYVDHQIYSYH